MTKDELAGALRPVLAEDALLVSDGNPTYRSFAQDAHLSHEAINLSAGGRVRGAVHVQNVNAYHGRVKQWLGRFHGVATAIWTITRAGSAAWTTTTPTLAKAPWRWPWGNFHI